MIPLTTSLHIHTDSEASVKAIRPYMNQVKGRKRLRMSGRPLLQLIHHLITLRDTHGRGATTQLCHVKAHTEDDDIHSVGNRLADFHANRVRSNPTQPTPHSLRSLPLRDCEHFLYMNHEHGNMIIDDIRRATLKRIKDQAIPKWPKCGIDQQGYFAHVAEGVNELGRSILKHGKAEQQTTMVLVVTNSIHYYWLEEPGEPIQQLTCNQLNKAQPCSHRLSLEHLATCSTSLDCINFRSDLLSRIIQRLRQHPVTHPWLASHPHCTLTSFLLALFPMPNSNGLIDAIDWRDLNFTTVMSGAFTKSQTTAASKTLGFSSATDSVNTFRELRLLCVERIQHFYSSRKQVILAIAIPP